MSKFNAIVAIVLCIVAPAFTANSASAATYAAGSLTASDPFKIGNFTTPTDLGLTPTAPIFQAVDFRQPSPPTNTTVNGVTFVQSTGQFDPFQLTNSWGVNNPTFADANLNAILSTYYVAFTGQTKSTTIAGLTSGQKYRLQLIIYDGDSGNTNPSYRGTTNFTIGSDSLTGFNDWTPLGVPNGTFTKSIGSYLNYDFVAGVGGTLGVSFAPQSAGGAFVVSAFDVQYLPEPTGVAVFALIGLIGLSKRRRT